MLVENHPLVTQSQRLAAPLSSLGDKIAFLQRGDSYCPRTSEVTVRETHMSIVFLAGSQAYKLKKPVRFPYLDFSTLERREAACRAELALNRRLAPDIYREVLPLTYAQGGLAIGGRGTVVDWVVVMKRLDESQMFDQVLTERRLHRWQLDRVAMTLIQFYRHASAVLTSPAAHIAKFLQEFSLNRRVLLNPCLELSSGLVQSIDATQRHFLRMHKEYLAERVLSRNIVDGHGDLRPEHIWLGDPVRIIDCLEFNARLRMVDPLDEIAFLSVECERLGAAWAGEYLRRRVVHALHDGHPVELFVFYRCHRAMLRARLAIAHLLETDPRTPQKWPALARTYLRLAAADAVRLEGSLRKRKGPRAYRRHADGGWSRPIAAQPEGCRSSSVRHR